MNFSDVGRRRLDAAEVDGLAIGRPNGTGTEALRKRNLGAALEIEAPNFGDPFVGGIATESNGCAVGRNGRGGQKHMGRECGLFAGAIVPNEVGVFGVGLRGIVGKNAIVGGGEESIAGRRESANAIGKRNGIARKFERSGIEFLGEEGVVPNEEEIARRDVESVENRGENEMRFGIVEGRDVESSDVGP